MYFIRGEISAEITRKHQLSTFPFCFSTEASSRGLQILYITEEGKYSKNKVPYLSTYSI